MTDQNKPSKNEDEYFARLDAERIERKRKELDRLATDTERKSHHMRCPKCGGHLVTEEFHRIQIDRCPDCHGVWFDNGEVDAVLAHEDKGLLGRVFGDVVGGLRGKRGK